jgi:enamine deaminase RidA (YjgF/YER057c/UK114 family)
MKLQERSDLMIADSSPVPKMLELYIAEDTPRPLMSYSPCIRAGNWLFTAGQLATDFVSDSGVAPEVFPPNQNLQNRLALEADFILNNLKRTLAAAGADLATDTVRLWDWYVLPRPTMDEFAAGQNFPEASVASCLEVQVGYFPAIGVPAQSGVGVRELLIGNSILEIDVLAFHPDDGETSVVIDEPPAMRPGAFRRQAGVRRGDWVFLSGQSALELDEKGQPAWAPGCDPTPATWLESPVEAQAERSLDRLEAILESAGSSLAKVVKADVYIGHPRDFAAIERVWKRRFPNDPPAKTVVPYSGLGARGQLVEIAVTALTNDSELPRQAIETSDAPEPLGHEPQAMRAGQYLFYSQQMAFDSTGALAKGMQRAPGYPYYGQPAKNQVDYMLGNVARIATAAGSSIDNVCKRQCFHDDYEWFAETWAEWRSKFNEPEPCSTTIGIGGPMVVEGAHVLYDLMGYIPG